MATKKLLIKLPSRERPLVLQHVVRLYASMCADRENTRMLITLDEDDPSASVGMVTSLKRSGIQVDVVFGKRHSKVEAVNRDLPGDIPWDLLLVASDDMWPAVRGYDDVVRRDMALHFPEGDGFLWYPDGRQSRVCTLPVMDRAYYERDGAVYHPEYRSYFADDEQTERALARGRCARLHTALALHQHPCWRGAVPDDALYDHNRLSKSADRDLYLARKLKGWD